jgi:choline dehydrogenase-like flavoprotein
LFIDAHQIPQDTLIETEVCIIGAGVAGITLARELRNESYRVCLLESGGLNADEQTQSLYDGRISGQPIKALTESRLRYFGGSGNHWAGLCRPLDVDDFEARPWIPFSGWPITHAEIDPYYSRAHDALRLGPYDYDPRSRTSDMPEIYRTHPLGETFEPGIFYISPSLRFGEDHREELQTAANIDVYLFANVVDIETNHTANTVTGLRVACLEGSTFRVRARHYVLATGGIENARLLLLANKIESAGLGNRHDLVGRFFMEHPGGLEHPDGELARITLSRPSRMARTPISALKKGIVTRIMLSASAQEKEGIAKFLAQIEVPGHSRNIEGYLALRHLTKSVLRGAVPASALRDLGVVVGDLGSVATGLHQKFLARARELVVFLWSEQVPNPESRVTLDHDRDHLGLNRVQLNWRCTSFDKHSLRRALELLEAQVTQSQIGRLRVHDWISDSNLSHPGVVSDHHMGTTRMGADAKSGVVDAHCRVHGISNLFVSGSSVFTTGGVVNPTLTIVALATRLADHLKAVMAQRA